ncbi:MAG: hypothetical protein J6J04_05340 [Oscillospiraceae bacterium]|nr:hypothetical protein [Oscillospiraceae bacterium]
MNKNILIPTLALCLLLLSGCTVDMTGAPYSEIEAYMAEHPNKDITYSVTIEGGSEPMVLSNTDAQALLTNLAQTDSLISQAEYLQNLTVISMEGLTPDAATVHAMTAAFPDAEIVCDQISFLGRNFSYDTTTIDLSDLTTEQVNEAIEGMQALPLLETVELCKGEALSTVSLDDASALCTACPDLIYNYRIKLFGQELSTDMEKVEYFRASIKDEGLEQFRQLIPLMHDLTYLKLDWCGTTDEAMAQLRDDFADRVKVVWRIFFHEYNCLTDTLKIWANWTVNDMNNSALKYCTDVKYLDLGHTMITHCEWAQYMPDLEVVIMGDCNLASIEPLRSCKKITFLEIFSSKVTDLSPLEDLTELKYLNISNLKIDDITPLYGLDNMIKVNSLMNHIPEEQVEEYKRLQPQVDGTFLSYGDPTMYGWRYDLNGHILPRYALLRQQFGYSAVDYSRYPTGYVTEEITYESTGITPPEAEQ